MKKILISAGVVLIMACIVVLFINAKGNQSDEGKTKAQTEATSDPAKAPEMMDCSACPSMKAASCPEKAK